MQCPICQNLSCLKIHSNKKRDYLSCKKCDLIFVPTKFHLKPSEEKNRYKLHLNSIQNVGYVLFLEQLAKPLLKMLPPKSYGLDFGCGPEPTLSKLMEEKGHNINLYDPYFFPNNNFLDKSYDFITATEVFEHLKNPTDEISKLWKMIKKGGHLGIMTKLHDEVDDFSKWRYKDDLTHISFYSTKTFQFLNQNLKGEMEFLGDNVILFKKH